VKENVLFFGWNRPIPGREKISAEHFQEFVQYMGVFRKTVEYNLLTGIS
jgi:hypothetical protein